MTATKMRTVTSIQKEQKKKEQRKSVLKFTLFLCGMFFLLFAVQAFAVAERYKNETLAGFSLYNLDSNLCAWIFKHLVYYAYGGMFQDMKDGMGSLLTLDTNLEIWDQFEASYNGVSASVGVGLAVVWVMFDLVEKAQIDQMTPEVIIRWAIKLIVAIMLINNAPDIAESLIAASNKLFEVVGDQSTVQSEALGEIYDDLVKGGFTKVLSIMIEFLFTGLVMWVCSIFMYVQIFGRLIEIGVRFMFLPIGISDAFTHGINSPGMRYIKKFFAVCLQGTVMYAVMVAGSFIMTNQQIQDLMGNFTFLGSIVVAITTIGLMMRSQQITNDIVGV